MVRLNLLDMNVSVRNPTSCVNLSILKQVARYEQQTKNFQTGVINNSIYNVYISMYISNNNKINTGNLK